MCPRGGYGGLGMEEENQMEMILSVDHQLLNMVKNRNK